MTFERWLRAAIKRPYRYELEYLRAIYFHLKVLGVL